MIERPERHLAAFAEAGADGITLHYEATPHVNYALAHVRDAAVTASRSTQGPRPTWSARSGAM